MTDPRKKMCPECGFKGWACICTNPDLPRAVLPEFKRVSETDEKPDPIESA